LKEEQPIVFVIDDDASARDAIEDLVRSVSLGVRSARRRISCWVRDDIVAVLMGVPPGRIPNREATAAQRYRIKPVARTRRRPT
jgi:hypothetical protein